MLYIYFIFTIMKKGENILIFVFREKEEEEMETRW